MNGSLMSYSPGLIGAMAGASLIVFAGLVWKVRDLLHRFKQQRTPKLAFGRISIQQPNSDQRTGSVTLPLMNSRGGEAQVKKVVLRIVDNGAIYKAGQIRRSQELRNCHCKLALRSDTPVYAVLLPSDKPIRLRKNKPRHLALHLTSDENHWYRMAIEVTWSIKRKDRPYLATSGQFYMEFPAR